jgi:hypothetical protein
MECFKKQIAECRWDRLGPRDAPLDQKRVELAGSAKNACGRGMGVSLGFEVSGKAIEMGTERASAEVNERTFFFVPVFEHRLMYVFV